MPAPVVPAITSGYTDWLQPKWGRVVVEKGMAAEQLYAMVFNVDPDMPWSPYQESQIASIDASLRPKPEGTGFYYTAIRTGGSVTYISVPWGMGFEWTIEMQRFDLYGIYDNVAGDLVDAGHETVELVCWNLFNDAFTGSFFTGFDGLPLAHTAHPYLNPQLGTFSNRSATDTSLSQAGLQEVNLYQNTGLDMQGGRDRRKLHHVLIHPNRIPGARECLMSVYNPENANNTINTVVDDGYRYSAIPYLTNSGAWHVVADKDAGYRGHDIWLRWTIHPLPDMFEDKRVKSAVHTYYQNFAVGFGGARGTWHSNGTGA